MDYEERKRKQKIKVIIAELGMVVSALAIVVVATLSAMGFFISSNGQIEQSGLAQIHSIPTGATVEIDGSTLFSRTNLSRTMSAGTHHLKLSRAGYDTWEKDINMRSGILLRIYYPRLFLQDRTPMNVLPITTAQDSEQTLEFYVPSNSRNYIIYALHGATTWQLLDIRSDEIHQTTLDLSGILPTTTRYTSTSANRVTPIATLDGEVLDLKWSRNDEFVLIKVKTADKMQWILVNLRNLTNSLNLTKTFGLNFEQIEFIDNNANQLFALENHHLRKIDTSNQSISKVLLDNITFFNNHQSNLIYLTQPTSSSTELARSIGIYKDGEKGSTIITTIDQTAKIQIALANYYDEYYIYYVVDNKPTILYGNLPSYSEKPTDLSQLKQLLPDLNYSTIPDHIMISNNNEFLVATKDAQIMVVDLDTNLYHHYSALNSRFTWFDDSMFYTFSNSELYVWDFDGTNQRNLSQSLQPPSLQKLIFQRNDNSNQTATDQNNITNTPHASIIQDYPLAVTANDRWLYYLTKNTSNEINLLREKLRD